jgi:hypothetical protein
MTATANPELIEEIANKFEENVTIVEKKPEEKQTAEHVIFLVQFFAMYLTNDKTSKFKGIKRK